MPVHVHNRMFLLALRDLAVHPMERRLLPRRLEKPPIRLVRHLMLIEVERLNMDYLRWPIVLK